MNADWPTPLEHMPSKPVQVGKETVSYSLPRVPCTRSAFCVSLCAPCPSYKSDTAMVRVYLTGWRVSWPTSAHGNSFWCSQLSEKPYYRSYGLLWPGTVIAVCLILFLLCSLVSSCGHLALIRIIYVYTYWFKWYCTIFFYNIVLS